MKLKDNAVMSSTEAKIMVEDIEKMASMVSQSSTTYEQLEKAKAAVVDRFIELNFIES